MCTCVYHLRPRCSRTDTLKAREIAFSAAYVRFGWPKNCNLFSRLAFCKSATSRSGLLIDLSFRAERSQGLQRRASSMRWKQNRGTCCWSAQREVLRSHPGPLRMTPLVYDNAESPPIVTSSQPISLFAPPPPTRTGPSSFVVSGVLHCVVLGLMLIAIKNAPNIIQPFPDQRYTVRLLQLQRTEPRLRWAPGSGGSQPASKAVARATRPGGQLSAPSAPRQLAPRSPSLQTLVQLKTPPNQPLLQQTPIPAVVMWRPENAPTPKIVLPPAQKVTVTNARPTLTRPNLESHVSDVDISSSSITSETLPVPASTSTPIAMPMPGQAVPESTSKSLGKATPATVISVSDMVAAEGTVALPLANEIASGSPSDSFVPGRPNSTSDTGSGIAAGQQNATGSGKNAGDRGTGEATGAGESGGTGDSALNGEGGNNGNGNGIGSGSGSSNGSLAGDPFAIDRITLPRNGQYGVVVVGASLDDEYPDTLRMWAGRLAYTVYLHVGLAKNWILQYSLPRDTKTAVNATRPTLAAMTRPDAPWPYIMVRPHIMPTDADSDAILVHGFINSGGHFEQLAVVFPPQFAQTKFVLGSLQQWQFRPATENGQLTSVEVLLIIPDEGE